MSAGIEGDDTIQREKRKNREEEERRSRKVEETKKKPKEKPKRNTGIKSAEYDCAIALHYCATS